VERPLRALILITNVLLTLAYVAAWYQWDLAVKLSWTAFELHLASGGIAVLLHFFACLGVIFYFVGTGLWIKEQSQALVTQNKKLAFQVWDVYKSANKLKGFGFPFATFGIISGVFTFILGGAYHVGAIPYWVHPTLATIMLGLAWLGVPFIFYGMNQNIARLDEASRLIETFRKQDL
jgi:hypothetical protein